MREDSELWLEHGKKNSNTLTISGSAVTICFSAGKDLFCFNSISPKKISNQNYGEKKSIGEFCYSQMAKSVLTSTYQLLLISSGSHWPFHIVHTHQHLISFFSQQLDLACDPWTTRMPVRKDSHSTERWCNISCKNWLPVIVTVNSKDMIFLEQRNTYVKKLPIPWHLNNF